MSDGERAKWLTALTRFGLGGKGAAPPPTGDPRAALEAELGKPGAGRIDVPWLASSQATLVSFYDYNARQNDVRARNEAMRSIGAAMPTASAAAAMIPAANMLPAPPPPNRVAETFDSESLARMQAAVEAPVGYVERLVAFWSNHFCISASKGGNVRILAGAFEREAIRPYVLGRFADMLKAVESHPAMLHYLDNSQSVGPDSPNGRSTKRGLNENLAREIMELHTLGANGGYAQADVTEFARALTGWTVIGPEGRLGPPGAFVFNVNAHEGGTRPLLGHEYEDGGYAQARAMLDDLARAPATARHIATKFARAFVADDPPAPLVARLAETFTRTDGDLGALARALISDDLAWEAPAKKLRDPWELTMSAMRALNLDPHPPQRFLRLLNLMGQPLWAPAGPNGFPTDTAAWASPVGVKARLEIAAALGKLAHDAPAPKDVLERALPGASEETREAVSRAESRAQAYALLIMAPEFQRR